MTDKLLKNLEELATKLEGQDMHTINNAIDKIQKDRRGLERLRELVASESVGEFDGLVGGESYVEGA